MKNFKNKSLLSFLVIFSLILVGCGKKKCKIEAPKNPVEEHKVVKEKASNPINSEYAFDESIPNLEDFSFIEEDASNSKDSAKSGYVAENDLDIDDRELSAAITEAEEVLAANDSCEFNRIMFGFNNDSPLPNQTEVISKNAERAKDLIEKGKKLCIDGHCCQMGQADYNLALSLRRANTIKTELEKLGIPSAQMAVVGCGQENPVVSSNSNDRNVRVRELAPNRRVELIAVDKAKNL